MTAGGWVVFWDGAPSVYVSDRHRAVHYRMIAEDIARHVPQQGAHVLDFGCGEALDAGVIAAHSGRLYLCDAAGNVRERLSRRFAAQDGIVVVAPETLPHAVPPGSLDLVVVNSVAQYLTPQALGDNIAAWKPLLAPGGQILFADIIPRDLSTLADAKALLLLGARHGFLCDAVIGLVRTYFSSYRKLRDAIGLTRYSEEEFLALLGRHGLLSRRVRPNLGHNQSRMAFLASVSPS